MLRLTRLTVLGIPYPINHRGNRRQPVFIRESDCCHYVGLLKKRGARFGV
ncbi:MAG: hypothetical protein ACE10H_13550 [Candidatus Binatia bacterium]